MSYTVYILYSETYNKIYIGYTSNLLQRFKSHNSLGKKGWTIRYRPWKVIYCDYFPEKALAMQREKQLKTARQRERILQKIKLEFTLRGYVLL